MKYILLLFSSFCFAQTIYVSDTDIAAFYGAKGHGRNTIGGADGDVYFVENLNADGLGSLQYGIDNAPTSGRNFIFRTSGWIDHGGTDFLSVKKPNLSIYGQSSPNGIGIRGEVRIQSRADGNAHDIIMQHVSVRADDGFSATARSGIRIVSYQSVPAYNIMLDHLSVGWANDENITITESATSFSSGGLGGVSNVSITNSIIDNNLNTGYPILVYVKSSNISIYQNLIAYSTERNPGSTSCSTFADGVSRTSYEMINNFVYHFSSSGAYGTNGNDIDLIGNVFERSGSLPYSGDDEVFFLTDNSNPFFAQNCGDIGFTDNGSSSSDLFLSDNKSVYNGTIVDGEYNALALTRVQGSRGLSSNILPYSSSLTKENVLENVGAGKGVAFGLNTYDVSLIDKAENDTGGSKLSSRSYPSDFPTLTGGILYSDSDSDGLSDAYESAQGGDVDFDTRPSTAVLSDGTIVNQTGVTSYTTNGFTHLQIFMNDLASGWVEYAETPTIISSPRATNSALLNN